MQYLIGIDGGGTKTKAVLSDLDGKTICTTEAGPSNILVVGETGVKEVCSTLVTSFIKKQKLKPEEIVFWSLGLAGAGRESDQKGAQKAVESLGFENKVFVTSDAYVALIGAFIGREGIITISGTGSICFGVDDSGQLFRSGGWGYLLGDEGSGYFIGQQALIAALKDYDHRGPSTKLRSCLENHFKVESIHEIIPRIYKAKEGVKEEIADIAPLVFREAASGDQIANEIILRSIEELGNLILSIARQMGKLEGSIEVATVGSIFLQKEKVMPKLQSYLGKYFKLINIHEPELEPVKGAILLGLKKLKIKVTDKILSNLKSSNEMA